MRGMIPEKKLYYIYIGILMEKNEKTTSIQKALDHFANAA